MSTEYEETVSIIVPFYNEEDNVLPLVERVHTALTGFKLPWELVLVDDGSTDATASVIREMAKTNSKIKWIKPKFYWILRPIN